MLYLEHGRRQTVWICRSFWLAIPYWLLRGSDTRYICDRFLGGCPTQNIKSDVIWIKQSWCKFVQKSYPQKLEQACYLWIVSGMQRRRYVWALHTPDCKEIRIDSYLRYCKLLDQDWVRKHYRQQRSYLYAILIWRYFFCILKLPSRSWSWVALNLSTTSTNSVCLW